MEDGIELLLVEYRVPVGTWGRVEAYQVEIWKMGRFEGLEGIGKPFCLVVLLEIQYRGLVVVVILDDRDDAL